MEHAIEKAAALIEAHQFIRRFRDKTVVVKIGGSIMDEARTLKSLVQDVCFMDAVGIKPILVHGGGRSITEAMQQDGLEAQFVQGRRYTDERTLAIAEHVLVNQINAQIISQIADLGHRGMGLHSLSSCVIRAQQLFLTAEDNGKTRHIDVGYVGQVEWVNADLLHAVLEAGYIPVIAPLARDRAGGKLNVNADSVAGEVASAVRAEKLVLVTDTPGIRTTNDEDGFATHVTKQDIERLVEDGTINSGMLPKVEASFTALEGGVVKTHIVDGRIPHSLLLEVYTNKGIGTEIVL